MPFKTFNAWLFDGNQSSPIPKDILKYNSPITHTYVVSLFLKNGVLNHYLDKYFNDLNLRYLTKEELFRFIKKCVIDFKIKKYDLMFYKRQKRNQLYEKLREKLPHLKNDDIYLLCDIIDKSSQKAIIYDSLGLEKPKKIKLNKKKTKKEDHISLNDFLEKNFSMINE